MGISPGVRTALVREAAMHQPVNGRSVPVREGDVARAAQIMQAGEGFLSVEEMKLEIESLHAAVESLRARIAGRYYA